MIRIINGTTYDTDNDTDLAHHSLVSSVAQPWSREGKQATFSTSGLHHSGASRR